MPVVPSKFTLTRLSALPSNRRRHFLLSLMLSGMRSVRLFHRPAIVMCRGILLTLMLSDAQSSHLRRRRLQCLDHHQPSHSRSHRRRLSQPRRSRHHEECRMADIQTPQRGSMENPH
ncbi:hypothetical protein HPB52_004073 [Rhipicephalus sanguineus]|uniref:Uncharacterized protein n=1 Tax=Rhipicephalus sanguineus TaxID=34632 RepID=A0A9D4PV75_RHISA|nr:hypothetical protein HPB52_004073 [Rhipicephalus sanguineus]